MTDPLAPTSGLSERLLLVGIVIVAVWALALWAAA